MAEAHSRPSPFDPDIEAEIVRLEAQNHQELMPYALNRVETILNSVVSQPKPELPNMPRRGVITGIAGLAVYLTTKNEVAASAVVVGGLVPGFFKYDKAAKALLVRKEKGNRLQQARRTLESRMENNQ